MVVYVQSKEAHTEHRKNYTNRNAVVTVHFRYIFSTFSIIAFVSPESDDLDPDLARLASLGFAGCLSVVQFNTISPLKAALLHPDTSPVIISGPLVQSNCGSAGSANPYAEENTHHLSGKRWTSQLGVIAVVIFVIVTGLAITARFLYRRKDTYQNQEVKGVKQDESPDFPFNNQADSQSLSTENPKEYFI
uniref:Neurexin/syndecan/glycophorin C domain-containing protein n=1 Tax=Acanthochromis polyacanthus TaxID=80966 RepID=A0A3Q1G4X0_9TELE